MKFVRKAVVLLLAAAMLFSFCACASGAEKTVLFSYEGTDFYSGTFSYMLSSEKAYYEQQFAYINYYYSGANLGWSSVLDEETGMTYADAVWESLVLNAKRMVIVNHLLKPVFNILMMDARCNNDFAYHNLLCAAEHFAFPGAQPLAPVTHHKAFNNGGNL